MSVTAIAGTDSARSSHGRRLAALTFIAVALAISLVGIIAAPAILKRAQSRYVEIQSDVNARQARSIARLAAVRLKAGGAPDAVTNEIQLILKGEQAALGYSCVIDRKNTQFLCHPMQMAVGMSVATKQADFLPLEGDGKRAPWEQALADGASGAGSLFYPDSSEEIVHMEEIPGTSWTVTTHENTSRVRQELDDLRSLIIGGLVGLGLVLAAVASFAARLVSRRHERHIEEERARSDELLLNILPPAISQRLKDGAGVIADRHKGVTVLFADIVGFTQFAAERPSTEVVSWLNELFSEYDDICARKGLEKIKTIGDSYMLCGGIGGDTLSGVHTVVEAGLEMVERLQQIEQRHPGHNLAVRIGIHTGDLVAGVIGKRKFAYDVWGDVVNTASRIESSGATNRVQISDEVAIRLEGLYTLEDRGKVELKGKGETHTWLVTGKATNEQPASA